MIGYKAFDRNLCCLGFQYEVGKTYKKDTKKEDMKLATNTVFHFCRELQKIELNSGYTLNGSRICEVIAGDVISNDNGLYGTNELTILREIVSEEKEKLIQHGICNSGCSNIGNFNSGDLNNGNCNSGNNNIGERNSGHRNTGNANTGDHNSGDANVGDWNSGDYNYGFLNTDSPKLRIFNKETNVDLEDIDFPEFFDFKLVDRFSSEGVKKMSYKKAWRLSWDNASDEDRRKVLALPNWNNEIFLEITGIDVEKELGINKE